MTRSNTEVICLKADVRLFHRVGFKPSASKAGAGRVRLIHDDPDSAFDALIELMATTSTPFIARIGRTSNWGVRRMAFAGNRLVVLGNRLPHNDELHQHRLVRAAFLRLASRSGVR